MGEGIRLRVDANQGYDVARAVFLKSRISGIQLMLDESIHTVKDADTGLGLDISF